MKWTAIVFLSVGDLDRAPGIRFLAPGVVVKTSEFVGTAHRGTAR